MDLIFILLTVVFFAGSWGLLLLCQYLMGGES
jgi:hypothetical protein